MPIVGQAILIYISSGILGLLASGLFGKLYRYIIGPYMSNNVGVIFSEGADTFLGGFIFGYLFFVGLLVRLFIAKRFWLLWILGFVLLGWTALWSLKIFGISLGLSLLGLLLGQLVRWARGAMAKKPAPPKA